MVGEQRRGAWSGGTGSFAPARGPAVQT